MPERRTAPGAATDASGSEGWHPRVFDGHGVVIAFEGGDEAEYTSGEYIRQVEDASEREGFRTLMGEVETASGHQFHAPLGICVEDVCEHYGTSLLVPTEEGWAWLAQGEGLDEWVANANREVLPEPPIVFFPYSYRYLDTSLREGTPHLDDEGWSRAFPYTPGDFVEASLYNQLGWNSRNGWWEVWIWIIGNAGISKAK